MSNELTNLKDKHLGKRCFIIGNGPSLNETDLTKLKDEVTIGCNYIFLKKGFKPTYYVVEDPDLCKVIPNELENWDTGNTVLILNKRNLSKLNKSHIPVKINHDNYDWKKGIGPKFSEDFSKEVYSGWNVAYIMLQLAYYLGCTRIYLIGMDGSEDEYSPVEHFYSRTTFIRDKKEPIRRKLAWKSASNFLSKQGINIYDATINPRTPHFPTVEYSSLFKKASIFHFCVPLPSGNFGDDALTLATKETFENIFDNVTWVDYPLRNHTSLEVIKRANKCDLVLVGGGGLLLKDTNENDFSGWQWSCSLDHLDQLIKPLIIYSIGYNKFRGQDDFTELFKKHINEVFKKAVFFSVRDEGSKEALIKYGLEKDKIIVNPCPSIFLKTNKVVKKEGPIKIAFNLAGDRRKFRFNKKFKKELAKCIESLKEYDCEIHWINHNWNPESNCQDIIDSIAEGTVHDVDSNWDRRDVNKVLNLYKSMDVVVAMRGHGQIIPFGLGVKVVSLISHDKLRWFAEENDMLDYSVEINVSNLGKKLAALILKIFYDVGYYKKQTRTLSNLKEIFTKNCNKIKEVLK